MRNLLSVSLAAVFVVALGACEEQPTTLESTEASASHGSSTDARTVTVELKEINDSGISGWVTLTDDGETIVVSDGSATGMVPNTGPVEGFRYLSLYYDKASPPEGPEACEPGTHDPDHPLFLTEAQMLGGIWASDADGNGSVFDLDGDYVPVDRVGTMSIRDLTVNGGFGPEAVVACGKVTHDPAND